MQAYEFSLQTSARGELLIPLELQALLQQRRKARAIFLFEEENAEWKRLAGTAVSLEFSETGAVYDDLPAGDIAKLAEHGGAFDFLTDSDEDIYSDDDLKVRYR